MILVRNTPSPKRFYEAVRIGPGEGGLEILLDGKPVRTPASAVLALPASALAQGVAAEWDAQGDKIEPETMPLTKRACTAIDQVRQRESEIVEEIVSYAASDLLCYRADSPEGLAEAQCTHWDPVLAWAGAEFGADFKTGAGISHLAQREASLGKIRTAFDIYGFFELTPLHTMTTLTGSALLVLAHSHGRLNADEIWAAAHVDEDWQISRWGEDGEATARRTARRAEFGADARFLNLLRN